MLLFTHPSILSNDLTRSTVDLRSTTFHTRSTKPRSSPHPKFTTATRLSSNLPNDGDIQPRDYTSNLGMDRRKLEKQIKEHFQSTIRSHNQTTDPFHKRIKSTEQGNRLISKLISEVPLDDEEYSFEERALLSLVENRPMYTDIDESQIHSLSPDDQIFPSNPNDLTYELPSDSVPLAEQTPADSVSTRRQLDLVKRRRKKIAEQRGETWINSNSKEDEDVFETLRNSLAQVDTASENPRELQEIIDSIAISVIVDFAAEKSRSKANALTAGAYNYFHYLHTIPRSYSPFSPMQSAFFRILNPPCPRCHVHTSPNQLDNVDGVCDQCYRTIFLQSGPADVHSGDPSWVDGEMREEIKIQEQRLEKEAATMTQQILNELTGKETSTNVISATASTQGGAKGSTSTPRSPVSVGSNGMTGNNQNGQGERPPAIRMQRNISDGWNVRASARSLRTVNPIRNLVQNIDVEPNPEKDLIKLSVGDPTVYGNLKVSDEAIAKFCEVIQEGKSNGYSMSMGSVEARTAVAQRYSLPNSRLTADDVVLATGTSGAIELALGAIANEGDNVILPRPGFPLFTTIAEGYGIECRYYGLDPERNWEIKLADIAPLTDNRTRAIVVNNPSNPCGSVFSATHVEEILAVASALRLPVIADEVYADMVFSDCKFTPIAAKSDDVPVLSVGGISKQFVVPGWRLGWLLLHDRNQLLEKGDVKRGIRQLTTRMLVPNTPTQALVPTLLEDGVEDNKAFQELMKELESNAQFTVKSLATAKGIQCIQPQGAMYVMAKIDVKRLGFEDDMQFAKELLREEAVFVLPGQCFQAPNFVRIVFSAPQNVLAEAFFRIRSFCSRRLGGM